MDLTKKSLQSLRDLALRMGIGAATVYKKQQLIEKIEERRIELEKGSAKTVLNHAGRPRLDNGYIRLVKKADGSLVFCDDLPENQTVQAATAPPPVNPIIKDKIIVEKLEQAADILRTLYIAIDTLLENS